MTATSLDGLSRGGLTLATPGSLVARLNPRT